MKKEEVKAKIHQLIEQIDNEILLIYIMQLIKLYTNQS